MTVLNDELQIAPIYGFATDDFNGDGMVDILAAGNFYGNQANLGRDDASFGHFLTKGEPGNWEYVEPANSGFAINGEARDIKVLNCVDGGKLVLVSRNDAGIQIFKVK